MIDWHEVAALAARMPLPEGYSLSLLQPSEVGLLIDHLRAWFPDIGVGSASGYLRDAFYAERVFFEHGPQRQVLVLLQRYGNEVSGMFAFECDWQAMTIHAQVGAAAPGHRGSALVRTGMAFTEQLGRRLGMGLVYGMATLKAPHAQRAFEGAGWKLIGIAPGLDRELVAPGTVRRVYEAVYAKTLGDEHALQQPRPENMTPSTRDLFERLFGAQPCLTR